MGLMDLSTSTTSKKRVDFNDARYQLSDKLRQSGKKNVRSTFTLYDNKEYNKVAVQEISAAYALSDKKMPMGELLNKILDLIIDLEDGILDTEKDAVYTWKYAVALLTMYEDKKKRQETLSVFDNGFKNAIIGSRTFQEKFPGKYTLRTNFFDKKVRVSVADDIINTFKDTSLGQIHETAIRQSHATAERHSNPIMDRIVQWAIDNYKCEVDSFYEVKEDIATHLFFSINTIILHLKNGYDMSIIGYVGTDHDDKFAISIFSANDITIDQHGERISQSELQKVLSSVSVKDPVAPMTQLLEIEQKKNDVLRKQYEILSDVRPMIPADVLEIKAAESVVGQDYIWGCKNWRETHEDLPKDFELADVVLPTFNAEDQGIDEEEKKAFVEDVGRIADSMDNAMVENKHQNGFEDATKYTVERAKESDDHIAKSIESVEQTEVVQQHVTDNREDVMSKTSLSDQLEKRPPSRKEDAFGVVPPVEELFDLNERKTLAAKFGDLSRMESAVRNEEKKKAAANTFDTAATLLPGFAPIVKPKQEDNGPSITREAKKMPTFEKAAPMWKEEPAPIVKPEKKKDAAETEIKQPDLLLDDLDSLFA